MIMKYFNKLPKLRVAGSNPVCRSIENQIVIARFLSDFAFKGCWFLAWFNRMS